jgi:hypothetical protein
VADPAGYHGFRLTAILITHVPPEIVHVISQSSKLGGSKLGGLAAGVSCRTASGYVEQGRIMLSLFMLHALQVSFEAGARSH